MTQTAKVRLYITSINALFHLSPYCTLCRDCGLNPADNDDDDGI